MSEPIHIIKFTHRNRSGRMHTNSICSKSDVIRQYICISDEILILTRMSARMQTSYAKGWMFRVGR